MGASPAQLTTPPYPLPPPHPCHRHHHPSPPNHLCHRSATVSVQYDVPPEIYATSWLVTLFARNLPVDLVMPLWDFLIVYNNPPLVHCVLLALLERHRLVVVTGHRRRGGGGGA